MAAFFREFGVVLLVAFLPVVACLLQYLYFVVLPQRAIKKYAESDPERLRRYLERVVATPSMLDTLKLIARGGLVGIYFPRGQHAAAAAHCRASLASLSRRGSSERNAALEADTRRRLADCLEALGQVDEAAEERRRAVEGIARAPADTLRHLTQGTLLERQNRYEEAYATFLQALELAPASNTPVRIECMMHLVLAAYNSGRPVDSLRWADEAITLGATGRLLRSAHTMAGLACGNLSRLEESEQHYRQAYDVSAAENNTSKMAETLGSLADCLRKRGKLAEANAACVQAAAMDPKAVQISLAVQSQILREQGRYDDALAVLVRFKAGVESVIPAHKRRTLAACDLDAARIAAECGRASDAWLHIQEALAVLSDDPKLGLKCEAACAWVLAARGLTDESQSLAAQLEPRLSEFERDPSTCRGVLYDLGMAACIRGDHHAGIVCWTRYLALSPDPVHQPTAHYHRGECHRQLGQLTEAHNDYRAAVAMNLDTHDTRLARRRLSGFTVP